jgi:prepilin-type N-terminal cleavage/methylation domain-containing protein
MIRSRVPATDGLTLVEVLVAIVILTVGILALAQFQAASLRNTALAAAINQTTRLVRGELEWQRQTAVSPDVIDCESVLGGLPPGFTNCEVQILPCALVFGEFGGSTLVCDEEAAPSTFRVTVTAVGPLGQELTLNTLFTGLFVSGAAGAAPDGFTAGQ